MSFEEIKAELRKLDEVTLLELLQVSSEDLVEKFEQAIINHYPYIYEQIMGERYEVDL